MSYNTRAPAPKHKVFVSYHHANDQYYCARFEELFAEQHHIIVNKSVRAGDIDPYLQTETVRQIIRDEYLRDSTVTVVLVGAETWQRKHVDWEIGSSIRNTRLNPRSGLIGIILPNYPRPDMKQYYPQTIPPRLYFNILNGFATLHNWSEEPSFVADWIHAAFERRYEILPDNSYPSFINNRSGAKWQ
jgi:hypothetical protein